MVEGPAPARETPPAHTPLSTIPEEDSIITEDSLFTHEDPNLQHPAYLAGLECLKCANDGDLRTDYEEPEEQRVPPQITDAVESLVAEILRSGTHGPTPELQPEEYVELWYTSDTAKLAYRPGGSQQAEPEQPGPGEYLCIRSYAAASKTPGHSG